MEQKGGSMLAAIQQLEKDLEEAKKAEKIVKTKVHKVEVVKHGQKLIIPEGVSYEAAIEQIQQIMVQENTRVQFSDIFECFVPDGAQAFAKAMERMFGYSHQVPTPGFFGPTPPAMITIATSPTEKILVPWGRFTLPGIEGWIATQVTRNSDKSVAFVVTGEIKKKHEDQLKQLCELTRKIVKDESIYKGKAFKMRLRDENNERVGIPDVKFLDLSGVKEHEIVFSDEVRGAIETSVFTPIEKTEACRKAQIPLKRGILLSGPYGTGKTLVTYVTAAKCARNGWTFLYCERASELSDMVKLAKQYQPSVLFCEDVDRVTAGDRSVQMDDILNIIDGIESKNSELMVVLTTNHVERINRAMLRPGRLDAVINVLPPDAKAAEKLVRLYGRDLIPENADLTEVGKRLTGQIPAVIRECVERAKLSAVKLSLDGQLILSAQALLDASLGMKNQLDLLKGEKEVPEKEKMAKLIGETFVQGMTVEKIAEDVGMIKAKLS